MQYRLSHPPALDIILQKLVKSLTVIWMAVAIYPLVRELFTYILTKLYEVFIQNKW